MKPNRLLLVTGVIGLVLSALCFLYMMNQGSADWSLWLKPVTFNAAIGIFILTTALFLPLSGMRKKSMALFSWVLATMVMYGYAVETIQTYRGVDPRFASGPFLTDVLPGILFGISSMTVIVLYVILTVVFFLHKPTTEMSLIVTSIRFGSVATMLGFASGVWMILLGGRVHGVEGNLMAIHFLGFHGWQAIPITAWLLTEAKRTDRMASSLVQAAGWLWLVGTGTITLQAYTGVPVTQLTAYTVIGYAALLSWFAIAFYSFLAFLQYRRKRFDTVRTMTSMF